MEVRRLTDPPCSVTLSRLSASEARQCSKLRAESGFVQSQFVANAQIVRHILSREDRGPKRDAVLLNAAAALFVADKARSLSDGWDLAAATIDSGKANAKLAELAAR